MAAEDSSPPPAELKAKDDTQVTEEPTKSAAATGDAPAVSKSDIGQVDGASTTNNGNALADTELKVEVKLADLQADPDNPLYSAKTFEELQLYALLPKHLQSCRDFPAAAKHDAGLPSCSRASTR